MENVLMQVCRETHNLTKRQVARKMGIPSTQYYELETAKLAMTTEHGKALENLYNIKSHYFLEAARQLEQIRTQKEIIKQKKDELKRLNDLMEGGYEFIHQSKQAKAS
ncbi:helix-turn-helix transcriptional regulator [Niastella caeni]|uniref:Helix-turn-helix transcriptional regulator n=1 Tax=Niastella caeni TaxID=2569763 RepID=A0A4S8I164_9BACT|nr:helix-turn-helix transcriptional regulator [Niastella caeni]THU41873.1 helix-turn-helix transcriptional regulator [Niastella caeni]